MSKVEALKKALEVLGIDDAERARDFGMDDLGIYSPPLWCQTWEGMGTVIDRMEKLGYRLKLMRYPDGWYGAFSQNDIDSAPWCASQFQDAPTCVTMAVMMSLVVGCEEIDRS